MSSNESGKVSGPILGDVVKVSFSVNFKAEKIRFLDGVAAKCHLKQPVLITKDGDTISDRYVWFGHDDNPMLLSERQVQALVNHLQSWLARKTFEVKETATRASENN